MSKRCKHCDVMVAGAWNDGLPNACARFEDVDGRSICQSLETELLRTALRRALVPEAFDENARIKDDELMRVLDAEQSALRQAAALRGPVGAHFKVAI